jgi:hypothetical protein
MIKQRLHRYGVFRSIGALKFAIQAEWDKITLEEINNLIASMPERCAEIVKRGGKPLAY